MLFRSYGKQSESLTDGKPYSVKLKVRARTYQYELTSKVEEAKSIITDETGEKALCAGDSGGPWYTEIAGQTKLVAVTVGASGCNGIGSGRGGTFGTLIWPFLEYLNTKWKEFLQEENELKAAIDKKRLELATKRERAKIEGTYLVSPGCHANGINAEIQIYQNETWQRLSEIGRAHV